MELVGDGEEGMETVGVLEVFGSVDIHKYFLFLFRFLEEVHLFCHFKEGFYAGISNDKDGSMNIFFG